MSWIHASDFVRAIHWIIAHEDITGAVNMTAPNPLPNREFMRDLRAACDIPVGLPATKWMLELGAVFMHTETELMLKSRRVVPAILMRRGPGPLPPLATHDCGYRWRAFRPASWSLIDRNGCHFSSLQHHEGS